MLIETELWQCPPSPGMIVVTTNSVATSGLVMGRGSAAEAVKRIPGIRAECERAIRAAYPGIVLDGTQDYGFLVIRKPNPPKVGFGIFQTKRHWQDVSSLETIRLSARMLAEYAIANPNVTIRAPFPGAGYGQIGKGNPPTQRELLDALRIIPNNVIFVRR